METKVEKKEVKWLVVKAIVAIVCCYLAFVLGKEFCSQFEQLNVALIVICMLSMLFIGYLHFRGIFAFWSITDDADEAKKYLNTILVSENYDSKEKNAVKSFNSLFMSNIITIAIYFVVIIINKYVSYELSERFYLNVGSIILVLSGFLIGAYFYCVRLKVFPTRKYTMRSRDSKEKKKALFWYYVSEIGFRLSCVFWMMQLIIPEQIFHKPFYGLFLGIMFVAFWGFYIWYLAQKDRV